MGSIVSYRDLEAWQSGMDLLLSIYDVAAQLPPVERFGLTSQLRRAAVSSRQMWQKGRRVARGVDTGIMFELPSDLLLNWTLSWRRFGESDISPNWHSGVQPPFCIRQAESSTVWTVHCGVDRSQLLA
jgi:hypothetical protein